MNNTKRNQRSFAGKRSKVDPHLFIKTATQISQEVYTPTMHFADYPLSEQLKQNIEKHGYIAPTQIQDESIRHILNGRDVIGFANTGTGKTAAFLIPLIEQIMQNNHQHTLIITPTRELAMQIMDELNALAYGIALRTALLIGGANIDRQMNKLYHNPHFVIGTPGRIKDLMERKKIDLQKFQHVVLDEVDRMVDIGFIKDIKLFISMLPQSRQSLFFSATASEQVKSILQSFVHNPITVSVKQQETAAGIEQDVIKVTNKSNKIDMLHDLLAQEEFEKVLVFGRTKWGIEKLSRDLIQRGFRVASIHGNKSQGQRNRSLQEFKSDKVQILLATDVASRGLDIENVTHVINFDAPESYDDYVHRIGRTGRAGKTGKAITFVE